MTPVLPDIDELVRAALTAELPQAKVFTLWPDDWAEHLPLVVARRVAGAAPDPRGLDAALIDVQAAAGDRRAAHYLARQARAVLFDACAAQFSYTDAGGYLSHFQGETSGPAEIRDSHPTPGTDLFRFQATYRLTARPAS
ncbi:MULTISPECIES: hypothetical protein [unclassified Streptomyces]|uniref:phage tail termination protein n=1 Tax=unclassified Streptomyces TaxID=2593676 RepID=UPI00036AD474|nr:MULTISPECIES: hypothetical protein [unclassified Streptomyces]MYT30469.1 hypothetical protein [Streptomyces sp. SID8354]